jgi:hypothetical protein
MLLLALQHGGEHMLGAVVTSGPTRLEGIVEQRYRNLRYGQIVSQHLKH